MRVLFLGLLSMEDVKEQNIYLDLLKTFRNHGHKVVAVAPRERRTGLPTLFTHEIGIDFLRVSIGNIQKTNLLEKGVSTLLLRRKYAKAMRKYLSGCSFDLILFSTPPTTLAKLVLDTKRMTKAKSYLLLKDIFPQNSVDLGILSKTGLRGLVYRYFRKTERMTYAAADWIGCMSEANCSYLLAANPEIDQRVVEVNPNSLIPRASTGESRDKIREHFGLPLSETVFAYGGNLGKPQAIDFLLEVLHLNERAPVCRFVVAGEGTERFRLEEFSARFRPKYFTLLPGLPRGEFDRLLTACDAGIILLDSRFTVPNFPSRVLSYMQASLPVLVASDPVCDMGSLAIENGFGLKCISDDAGAFLEQCRCLSSDVGTAEMGIRANKYMIDNYTSERSYEIIMEHFNGEF